jgi:hypothetical protein
MMTVLPPVAWMGHLDDARDADIGFLALLVRDYAASVIIRGDPLGSLTRLLDLPFAVASLLSAFGVGMLIGVRGVAALLVGTLVGLEAKKAILADALAEPLVSHVKGPRLVAGRWRGGALRLRGADASALPIPVSRLLRGLSCRDRSKPSICCSPVARERARRPSWKQPWTERSRVATDFWRST